MHVPVGKPLLALMSAACITVPATAGAPHASAAAAPTTQDQAVALTAGSTLFDPLPAAARSVVLDTQSVDPLAQVDIGTLVDLVTFPYHNAYAIGSAFGRAANAGIQVVGLPLSLAYFLATNASDTTIQNYLNSVQTNVNGAIPGIIDTIQDEIAYDLHLFGLGGATATASTRLSVEQAAPTDGVTTSAAVDLGTLVDLATFPYHNAYAVGSAVGRAANAGIQVVGLPLSLGYFLATNASDTTIQNYLNSVQANVNGAIPGILDTIQDEIDYDRDLFTKAFGGTTTVAAAEEKVTALDSTEQKTLTATDGADLKKAVGALGTRTKADEVKPGVETKADEQDGAGNATGVPAVKHSVRPAADLAAAVKSLGGPRDGFGFGTSTRGQQAGDQKSGAATGDAAPKDTTTKQDNTKQDNTKQDTTKQDTTKQDTTKQADKQDPSQAKDRSGDTGGRHRRAE
jgi:hypothetical protein